MLIEVEDMNLESYVRDALKTAQEALNQIASHERLCDERYRNLEHTMMETAKTSLERHDAHERRMDGIMKILWTTAFGTMATLLTACGGLILLLLEHFLKH
jgi:hypothetical protein